MSSVEAAIQPDSSTNAAVGTVTRGRRAKWWQRRGTKRRGFHYETVEGRRITDEAALERIGTLAIPPAWKEVRVAPGASSPLQAIGVDACGRVQRIYHASFVARQQRRKYEKIERFGELLPALRHKTNEDIAREGLGKERVLAVVVRLINELYFRVGSEESVKRYRTYGVTTLRNRHLEIKDDGELVFNFVGKHHIRHRVVLVDEELAALMREIKALKGARLFNYKTEDGKACAVRPRDVNEYIKSVTAPEFSAKDFRTWGATMLAAIELAGAGCCEDEKEAKHKIVEAVERVSERLGNTPSVCRSSYIHPSVLESYLQGKSLEEFRPRAARRIRRQQDECDVEEIALLKLLRA